MNSPVLARVVLDLSALLYCLVVGMFIVPLLLDRLVFYLPRLGLLAKEGAVHKRSVMATVAEILGWAAVLAAVYVFLYFSFPAVFALVSTSWLALVAWAVAALNLTYRFVRFNRVVKREFYTSAYMHHITPRALKAYHDFLEELEDMNDAELQRLAALGRAIPYMHRQAVHRKLGEHGLPAQARAGKRVYRKGGKAG